MAAKNSPAMPCKAGQTGNTELNLAEHMGNLNGILRPYG